MFLKRIRTLALIAAAGLGVSACTYGDGGYGYTGLSLGVGSGGYYDPYYDGYGYGYNYYGNSFGSPYWGWYGDYYYPGTGYYVYDRYRRPHRWNDGQRRYWEQRRHNWRGNDRPQNNWHDFRPGNGRPGVRPGRPGGDRPGIRPGQGRPRPDVQRPDRPRPDAQRPDRPRRGEWRSRGGSRATPSARPASPRWGQGSRSGSPRSGNRGGSRPRER